MLTVKPKTIYLLLSIVGFAAPYAAFLPWLAEHGPNGRLFLEHLFANRICAFFALDVVVSALALLRFSSLESRRLHTRWIVLAATLLVGVSLGLPLFLYFRERQLELNPTSA